MYILDRRGGNDGGSKKYSLGGSILPNKQKPVKNTRLFGVFHTSDLSISRDNSRVVEVNVDDLITGLGPSFCTAGTRLLLLILVLCTGAFSTVLN